MKARIESTIRTTIENTLEAVIEITPETTLYLHFLTRINDDVDIACCITVAKLLLPCEIRSG
jgi:hypothetical protein